VGTGQGHGGGGECFAWRVAKTGMTVPLTRRDLGGDWWAATMGGGSRRLGITVQGEKFWIFCGPYRRSLPYVERRGEKIVIKGGAALKLVRPAAVMSGHRWTSTPKATSTAAPQRNYWAVGENGIFRCAAQQDVRYTSLNAVGETTQGVRACDRVIAWAMRDRLGSQAKNSPTGHRT